MCELLAWRQPFGSGAWVTAVFDMEKLEGRSRKNVEMYVVGVENCSLASSGTLFTDDEVGDHFSYLPWH